MTGWTSGRRSNRFIFPWLGMTGLSLAVACVTHSGTDGPDGDLSGGTSSGGRSGGAGGMPSGGQAAGGLSSGGQSAGGSSGFDEGAARDRCLAEDPEAVFEQSESGCWVCKLTEEREVEVLDFGAPQCFDYGFQLRSVYLGCGYVATSWQGDAGDSGGRVYALVDSSDGLGGEGGDLGTRFNAVQVATVGRNGDVCTQYLYGVDEIAPCDSTEKICPSSEL